MIQLLDSLLKIIMTPSQAEISVDPTPLYNQILSEYSLLWNIANDPHEFDELDAEFSEYYYRHEIFKSRRSGIPYFKHIITTKELTEQMQVMMQRHNVLATFANVVSDMFLMRILSYDEYYALARACVLDVILNIYGEEYSKNVRQILYEQDYVATEFYGVFSKAVDAALAGDYRFAIEDFEDGSPVQISAAGKVREGIKTNFWDFREDFIIRKKSSLIDVDNFYISVNGIEDEIAEDQEMITKNGITKEMSTYEAHLKLDASLAVAAS